MSIHQSPLIHSTIGMTAVQLDTLVNYIKMRASHEREELGWGENRSFKGDSLFAKWGQVERQVEQDFQDRVTPGGLFEDSNLSQNLPFTIASQHADRITRDLLDTPKFFDMNVEGSEDASLQAILRTQAQAMTPQDPNMPLMPEKPESCTDLLMRVLHRESRMRMFNSKLADTIMGILTRGHEILRPSYERRIIPRRMQLQAWTVNGQIVRNSKNEMVMADQEWQADPAKPEGEGELILKSDPRIRLPVGTIITKSEESYGVNRRVTVANGCDIYTVYWADFVIPVKSQWDSCDFRGHFFQSSVDDVMTLYPIEHWTKEGKAYWKRHVDGTLGRDQNVGTNVTAANPVQQRGESGFIDDNSQAALDTSARYQRTYFEWWGRYDADKDGYAEPIHVLLDWEDGTVVRLEGSNIVLPWMDSASPHPYQCPRVFPVDKRWFGTGYYDVYGPWHKAADRWWNQAIIDMDNSGNMFFKQRGAYANPNDSEELGFGTNRVFDLLSGTPASQAFQVVNAPSAGGTYLDAMDRITQRIQAHGGTMGAADPSSSALPGAETLGGLNRILEQGDVFVAARERELIPVFNETVKIFSDIVIFGTKQDPSLATSQIGPENMQLLMMFLEQRPEHVRDLLEVNLSKAFGSGQVQTATALAGILDRWIMIPSIYKEQMKPAYEWIIRGLGYNNAKDFLKDPEAMMLAMQEQSAQNEQEPAPQQ